MGQKQFKETDSPWLTKMHQNIELLKPWLQGCPNIKEVKSCFVHFTPYGNISKKTSDPPCQRKALCFLKWVDNMVRRRCNIFLPNWPLFIWKCTIQYGLVIVFLHRMICNVWLVLSHSIWLLYFNPKSLCCTVHLTLCIILGRIVCGDKLS